MSEKCTCKGGPDTTTAATDQNMLTDDRKTWGRHVSSGRYGRELISKLSMALRIRKFIFVFEIGSRVFGQPAIPNRCQSLTANDPTRELATRHCVVRFRPHSVGRHLMHAAPAQVGLGSKVKGDNGLTSEVIRKRPASTRD
jgi:hypothetical protein